MNKEDLDKAKELNCKINAYENVLKSLEKQTICSMESFFQDFNMRELIPDDMFNRFKDELITHTTVELDKAKAEFEAL